VVPGRTNQFDFNVNESDVGQTFRGQCAELCGTGHSIMLFEVKALSAADFDAWLKDKAAKAAASPAPAPSGAAPSGPAPSGVAPSGPAPSGAAPSGPAPSGAAPGETLQLTAQGIKFDQSALTAKANTPFRIDFKNQDPATPHNVAIHKDSPTGQEVFKGDVFPGVAEKVYEVPALPAGAYAFVCTVHPTMTGTLTVQ
jgi:plastocyanin